MSWRCVQITVVLMTLVVPSLAEDMSFAGLNGQEGRSASGSPRSRAKREQPVSRFKRQAVQKVSISGGWLISTGGTDLNTSHLQTSIGLGVPLGSFENILGVTPSFRVDWLDANPALDVPQELFEAGINLFYRRPLRENWSVMAIARPSVRSDFTTSDNAFRLFGLALLNWEHTADYLTLSFGTVYLDRADLPVLPAVGLTWTPRTTTRLELRFPESRLAHRLAKDGCESETWAYVSAGIGGNTWAVTRSSGLSDELSIRDIRLRFGVEKIVDGGGGWFCEAGWAFGRRIEYEQAGTEVDLDDGFLLQAGWSY